MSTIIVVINNNSIMHALYNCGHELLFVEIRGMHGREARLGQRLPHPRRELAARPPGRAIQRQQQLG